MTRKLHTGWRSLAHCALLGAAFLGAMFFGARSASADIVYFGVGSVVGTITTDGNTGFLSASDFLAWNLTLNGDGASFTISSSDPTKAIELVGSEVFASLTKITFDFSASDDGYLLFQDGLHSAMHYWCSAASSSTCFAGKTVAPIMIGDGTSINILASGVQTIAFVPEPSTWILMGLGFGALALAAARKARPSPVRS
jgi:PEP-CTERM motif